MQLLKHASDVVDPVIDLVGKHLVIGTPLGAGKPNHVLNAFYQRAKQDPTLRLEILTALTLEKPKGGSDLERRFLGPMAERVFGDYPDLDYELDRIAGTVPANVQIHEFYFPPGKFAHNPQAQQNYISSNYTHAARDILARGVNVLASQVASEQREGIQKLSLSCNPDVAVDLMHDLSTQETQAGKVAFVAQVNQQLPFMYGDAEVETEAFDFLIDNRDEDYRVFGPPKMSVNLTDHMIGLNVSALVKDGGELQVGIGSIGDSVVAGLLMRQQHNKAYRQLLDDLEVPQRFGALIERTGSLAPFEQGLFSASEMMIDGFLDLIDAGVIKRRVYDDPPLQRLLNQGQISESVGPDTLQQLLQAGAISPVLTDRDIDYLRHFGVFDAAVGPTSTGLVAPDGSSAGRDLTDPETRKWIEHCCLGSSLKHGAIIHAGFFLGPQAFYQRLRQMPDTARKRIRMRSVKRINQLYGHEEIDRLHRRDGRFINTAMMATLSGAVVSDGLEDGTVISGVGGQYNFVAMAHELPGGRSIINLRSTRQQAGKTVSNIVLNYGHITIPRHLRDLVVTEYGIADLRSKTDSEIVCAMLNICDSRFQEALRQRAVDAGKLSADYRIDPAFCQNLPQRLAAAAAPHQAQGLLQPFPLGCDFTDIELEVGKALKFLKGALATWSGRATLLRKAAASSAKPRHQACLARMDLDSPRSAKEKIFQKLLCTALDQTRAG